MASRTRSFALGAGAVVMLAVAGFLFLRGGAGSANLPTRFTMSGVCLVCQKSGEVTFQANEPEPHVCKSCGKQAVYGWKYCSDCGYKFVPALAPPAPGAAPPRPPMVPVCPHCGGTHTGAYLPEDPDQQVKGESLPRWAG